MRRRWMRAAGRIVEECGRGEVVGPDVVEDAEAGRRVEVEVVLVMT